MTESTNRTAAPAPLNEQCPACFFKGREKCMCSEKFANPEAEAAPAPAAQAALPYPDLEGLRAKLLAPREIVRDADGWLTHPAYPLHDEDVCADKLLDAFGIETSFVSMEYDDSEAHDRYMEAEVADCSYWTPTRPDGAGWMLIEIYDTEDGPAAMFARERPKERPLSRRERMVARQQSTTLAEADDASRAAVRTLQDKGYTYHGGTIWRPPLGQPPVWTIHDSQGARDVLAERRRQVEGEGWTPEHDDAHEGGELADAAAALVLEACDYRLAALQHWPWADAIKDAPPRRNLVKAGALLLAEIERLDRAAITAAITANPAVNSERAQIIARAVQFHGRAWPEQLTSGVMFYEGERITKAEFLAEVRT